MRGRTAVEPDVERAPHQAGSRRDVGEPRERYRAAQTRPHHARRIVEQRVGRHDVEAAALRTRALSPEQAAFGIALGHDEGDAGEVGGREGSRGIGAPHQPVAVARDNADRLVRRQADHVEAVAGAPAQQ